MASRDSDPLSASAGEDREAEKRAEAVLRERVTGGLPRVAPPDLDELFAGVEQQLAGERGVRAWLRSRSTGARLAFCAASLALLVAAVALGWARPDLAVYPVFRLAIGMLVIVVMLGVQLALALRSLSRPPLPAWVSPAAIAGAPIALVALYGLPAPHASHPASVQAPGWQALISRALPCLTFGLIFALASYALLRALDRGGTDPTRRALLAAAYGGLVANLLLMLHCPITATDHLMVGHLGVAVLLLLGVAAQQPSHKGTVLPS
jgi:hypothetical protein